MQQVRRSSACLLAIVPLLIGLSASTAPAIEIKRVDAAGVRAWLVESRQLPVIVLDFAFRGAGSATDPPGREGLARFGAQMLLEGAGDLGATTFQERLSEIGAVLIFTADRDVLVGHLEVASEHWQSALDLLRLALTQPRFDTDAVERVRRWRAVELARLDADPGYVARRLWWRSVLPDHPYGRDPDGLPAGVAAISAADLRADFMPHLTRAGLLVGAAGAITAQQLAADLDRLVADLPSGSGEPTLPEAIFVPGPLRVVRLPFPQSACMFGQPGVSPRSADYLPALLLNHIVGGGTLVSRLFVEMREKRGLVYSVRTALETLPGADLVVGRFATENAKVHSAIELVKNEWKRAQSGSITDEEIIDVKEYLKGSFPVSLDGTAAIAAKLLAVQRRGLGVEYITGWEAMVDAVSFEAVRATAKQTLAPQILTFTVAGNPEDLPSAGD
jgi:zinc protease